MADYWNNYRHPDIAAKQRKLVDKQLKDMHKGNAPDVFRAIEPALWGIRVHGRKLSVLDAGCASGYYKEIMDFFAPTLVGIYHGVDSNPGMIAMAQRLYPGCWSNWDITNLDQLDDNSWDLVFSAAAIQYVENWQQGLRELCRVTRKWLLIHRLRLWTNDLMPTEHFYEMAYDNLVKYWLLNRGEWIGVLQSCNMSLELELPAGEGPIGAEIDNAKWWIRLQLWRKNEE